MISGLLIQVPDYFEIIENWMKGPKNYAFVAIFHVNLCKYTVSRLLIPVPDYLEFMENGIYGPKLRICRNISSELVEMY